MPPGAPRYLGKEAVRHFWPDPDNDRPPPTPASTIAQDLAAERHGWSRAHQSYNDAVGESFDRFMQANKIKPEQMTADQARSFVQEVMRSRDPRIRGYNLRLYQREFQYWLRRGPGRND